MPKASARARAIKLVSRYAELEEAFYKNQIKALRQISGGDEDLEDNIASLNALDDDEAFQEKYRMSKSSFDKLVDLVRDSPAYATTPLFEPQTDVRIQVAMALEKLGACCDGANPSNMENYDTGTNSLPPFMVRFFEAIMPLESQFVYWPKDDEKKAIIEANTKLHAFPDCLGFIDGELMELAYLPTWNRSEFYNKPKKAYGIGCIAVCDDQRRMRFIECGWHGYIDDMHMLSECSLGKHPKRFFAGDEYVLGDADYTISNYVMAPKKKPLEGKLSPSDDVFSRYIAMTHIKVKHAFAILKSRFPSLNKLPVTINCRNDIQVANVWIRACVILNNFLLDQRDDPTTIRLKEHWDQVEQQERIRVESGINLDYPGLNS